VVDDLDAGDLPALSAACISSIVASSRRNGSFRAPGWSGMPAPLGDLARPDKIAAQGPAAR
jgi:hypothetical protein